MTFDYYRRISPSGTEFVFVEDDAEQHFKMLQEEKDVKYVFVYNDAIYNKSKSYNIGLSHATHDNICFLDVDGVISCSNLLKAIETISCVPECICIGYNGTCMYFTYTVKDQIPVNVDNLYEFLDSFVDKQTIYPFYIGENYSIPNLKAMGGCLFGTKQTFKRLGGFNPYIKGWGFEDTEIIDRAKKLNIKIFAINTESPYFFHLPHDKERFSKKEDHSFFQQNHNENKKINNMSKGQIEEYINTWSQ
jgi:predicted glycosyltransferase involved in capsule biosynthesis